MGHVRAMCTPDTRPRPLQMHRAQLAQHECIFNETRCTIRSLLTLWGVRGGWQRMHAGANRIEACFETTTTFPRFNGPREESTVV